MSTLSKARRATVPAMLAFLLCAAGCSSKEGSAERHQIRGLVMALEPARNRVVIAHEEIPHYMKAMTMAFRVRDSSVLQGIEVGDSVRAVVTMKKPEVWLDSLIVIARMSSSESGR